MNCLLFITVVLEVCLVLALHGPIFHPPEVGYEFPDIPTCSSYGSLCGLDYRYVTKNNLPVQLLYSENRMCQCPGNDTCATAYDWSNMTNSIVQRLMTGSSHHLLVKISYCRLPEKPKRPCGFNQTVLVSRGRGLFKFDIVGDILCRCSRPLIQKSAWIDGEHDYAEYGCGQPKCAKRNTTVCSEITLSNETLRSQYLCRCRRFEMCSGDIPVTSGQSVKHTCQLIQ